MMSIVRLPVTFTLSAVLAMQLLSGCTLAPATPTIYAEPIGKGGVRVDTWATPVTAVSAGYGLTESLDVGVDVEQFHMISIRTQYAIVHSPGFSLAANGGIFRQSGPNNASGYYLGGVLSKQFHRRVRFYSGYRLSHVDYDPVDIDLDNRDLTDDELYYGVDSRDSEDLSKTSHLHLGLSIHLLSNVGLNLGAGCEYHHENNDPMIQTRRCGPLIGLSWGL